MNAVREGVSCSVWLGGKGEIDTRCKPSTLWKYLWLATPVHESRTLGKARLQNVHGERAERAAGEDIFNWSNVKPRIIWNERSKPPNEKKISYGHCRGGKPAEKVSSSSKAFLDAERWTLASSSG